MRRITHIFGPAIALAAIVPFAIATGASADAELSITVAKAPIVPDGTTTGAATDFVVTFADRDPDVPGVDILAGGSISVTLPADFVQDDPAGAMDVAILQGWPQSPKLPFPAVTYDPATNTVTATTSFDYLYESSANPGPKQAHLILLGFTNPEAGSYPITLTIQPDPNDPATLEGTGRLEIVPKSRPAIEAISITNGAPPPPFPNSIYQTVGLGEELLTWGFYVWDARNEPFIGVDIQQRNRDHYALVDNRGRTVGHVRIDAPPGATAYWIDANSSVPANGAVLGVPTGLLTAHFHPDPDVAGDYTIRWSVNNGNTQPMFVTVESG